MNIQEAMQDPNLSEADRKGLEEISQLRTKGDFERFLYEKSPSGRLSRSDCKMIISKMFRIAEQEAKQEAEQRKSIYNVMLGWFKTVAGRA